jgi:ribonuclease HI
MEKICYAVVMSARKLRHYFEALIVKVLTNQPVKDIFRNHDSSGRIGKWAMELSEHVIDVEKRSAIKSQVSGAGAAAILKTHSGIKLKPAARLQFKTETDKCSNNIAEYKVVLLGLRKLRTLGVHQCIVKTDSKVVTSQIEKECITRDETLERYLAAVRRMEGTKSEEVDELAKATTKKAVIPPDVLFQVIKDPSSGCTVPSHQRSFRKNS